MGCDAMMCQGSCVTASFNPRTHMGCDAVEGGIYILNKVSIHAPTWDATKRLCITKKSFKVSIHAPTWDATIKRPRPPSRAPVSIHAPTWDATFAALLSVSITICFNPRTHMGCDVIFIYLAITVISFNPRTHMGCDLE